MIENSADHSQFYVHKDIYYVPHVIWKVVERPSISQELGQLSKHRNATPNKLILKNRKGIVLGN